jgi:putative membrane protein
MRRMKRLFAFLLLVLPAPALAYDGEGRWTLAPMVTIPLALAALLYGIGAVRLWRRSDLGRPALGRGVARYAAGWLTLAGALVSPLHEAGESSFAMHMIEHEILTLVSALLLVSARPGAPLLWAFPSPVRAALAGAGRWRFWRALADPFVATAIQAVAIVAWHMPWLFDLALGSEAWHVAQHLSFVLSALLFWWAMLHGRGGPFVAASCLFLTAMIGGGLGALMALASSPWYPAYAALGLTPAGLTPAEDQQLAGLIMWVPGGAWHLAAALWFLMRALKRMEAGHAQPF